MQTCRKSRLVSERIRVAVEELQLRMDDGRMLSLTVSIGGTCDVPGSDLSALFSAADRSLYEAKNGGRNLALFDSGNRRVA